MSTFKEWGDTAELMVAADLRRQGHKVAFPFGEDWDADVLAEVAGKLERLQVKHARSEDGVLTVRCYTQTVVAGKVRSKRCYTAATIDWIAVYDATTGRCFYVPAEMLGTGRSEISLRLSPTRNNQRTGVHMADDYAAIGMEPAGIEPATS